MHLSIDHVSNHFNGKGMWDWQRTVCVCVCVCVCVSENHMRTVSGILI